MIAASYWSLLAPAIDMAASSSLYGTDGKFAFIPVSIGFFLGAIFVYGSDELLTFMVTIIYLVANQPTIVLAKSYVMFVPSSQYHLMRPFISGAS